MERYIFRVKRKLESGEIPSSKILKYLHQLGKLPVTFDVLKATSIGKTVNSLKKHPEKEVQENAKQLVLDWKNQLSQEKQFKSEANSHTQEQSDVKTPEESSSLHCKPTLHKTGQIKESHSRAISSDSFAKLEPSQAGISSQSLLRNERVAHAKGKNRREKEEITGGNTGPSGRKSYTSFDFLTTPQITADESNDKKEEDEPNVGQVLEADGKKFAMPTLPDIQLPELAPVYRPMHRHSEGETDSESPKKKKKALVSDHENMASNFVSRKSRTQVFSGRKYGQAGGVPSLYQQCMRVLTENIDALHDTGGVPYDILEPLLAKCTPTQLTYLEECNPYFLDDSDALWKAHCQREFKNYEPEGVTWRELYKTKLHEREDKLRRINERITQSQAKKEPVRQAKLAYVSSTPKAPFSGRRPKSKYSIDEPQPVGQSKRRDTQIHDRKRPHSSEDGNKNYVADCAVPCPVPRRDSSSTKKSAPHAKKPGSKPMMQAALKMMKKQKGRLSSGVIRR